MPAPRTRNWKAVEKPDFVGRRYELIVTGEVETPSSNELPKLKESVPQGFNQRILMLDLTIESTGGIGDDTVMYRKAEYRQPTNGDAYDEVEIFYDGKRIATIKVQRPKSMTGGGKKGAKTKPAKKAGKKAAKKTTAKKSAKKKSAKKTSKKKAGRKKRL